MEELFLLEAQFKNKLNVLIEAKLRPSSKEGTSENLTKSALPQLNAVVIEENNHNYDRCKRNNEMSRDIQVIQSHFERELDVYKTRFNETLKDGNHKDSVIVGLRAELQKQSVDMEKLRKQNEMMSKASRQYEGYLNALKCELDNLKHFVTKIQESFGVTKADLSSISSMYCESAGLLKQRNQEILEQKQRIDAFEKREQELTQLLNKETAAKEELLLKDKISMERLKLHHDRMVDLDNLREKLEQRLHADDEFNDQLQKLIDFTSIWPNHIQNIEDSIATLLQKTDALY